VVTKVAKLIRLLATDKGGEALAALEALRRTLRSAGSDFHALAAMIEAEGDAKVDFITGHSRTAREAFDAGYEAGYQTGLRDAEEEQRERADVPADWRAMARYCASHIELIDPKHRHFIVTMNVMPSWKRPTPKQEKYLRNLYRHVGGQGAAA
jgi:hypothetical protein